MKSGPLTARSFSQAWRRMERWRHWLIATLLLCVAWFFYWQRHREPEKRYDGIILRAARDNSVDPALVKAVIWRESRFKPDARGKVGEIGLMQINRLAAQEWAQAKNVPAVHPKDFFDPQININAGSWYLGKLLKRYTGTDNPAVYALADYNAGRSNVLRWNKGEGAKRSALFLRQMDYPMTRQYILTIMQRYRVYRHAFK